MKFVVSSTELLKHLNAISRVISNKNTLPILDNFLFRLEGKSLSVTASDLETTLITTMELDHSEDEWFSCLACKNSFGYLEGVSGTAAFFPAGC